MSSDADPDPPTALPRHTRLGEFELLRVLGIGGFGIVYLAFDHALEREVAVKEYMPSALAGRTATLHVSLRSQSDADTFALGLKSFVNEARMLARFDHPSLLKVHRFWEANGTAYMAMPVYRGRTLKEVRLAMANPPDEAWLRAMLDPLLGAIGTLHEAGVYHRDIAPDNILIEADGRPVLLDFGAARRVISDKSQTLTAILKPAYAPIEQYAEAGSVRQGPWTDIYALGATMHFMLLGRPPSPATARAVHDDQAPLLGQSFPGCSEEFLHLIDWMLAPRPTDRPQSITALRDVLDGRTAPPVRRAKAAAPPAEWEQTVVIPPSKTLPQPAEQRTMVMPQASTTKLEVGSMVVPPSHPVRTPAPRPAPPRPLPLRPAPIAPPTPAATPPARAQTPAPAPAAQASRMLPLFIGVGVLVVAIAAYALWPKSPVMPTIADAASAPAAAASVAIAAPPVPVPTPVPVVAVASAPASAPDLVSAPAASAPGKIEVANSLATKPTLEVKAPVRAASRQTANNASRPIEPVAIEASKPAPAPTQVLAATPASSAAQPVDTVVAEHVSGPRERCGSRVLMALLVCIERECNKSELRQNPECIKLRADQEKRANPTY